MSGKKYTFLLAGKTGVGKSSVGNSILGVEKFKVSDSPESETLTISVHSSRHDDIDVTVVDTPGFMGTELSSVDAKSKACGYMKKAMSKCPTDGKVAVVLVIKYGDKYTHEQTESLYILQNVFGEFNLWKSCLIVMTNGESFDFKYKTKTFDEYISEQHNFLGDLFKKSPDKCILFRNLKDKTEEKKAHLNALLKSVDNLKEGYTKSKFEEAKKEQNRLKLESKLLKLITEFKNKMDDIKSQVAELEIGSDLTMQKLKELENKVSQQLSIVDETDSPKKIFYKKGEERFLKNIYDGFFELKTFISDKIKKSIETKLAKQFSEKINVIDESISQAQESRIVSKEYLDFEKELQALEDDISTHEFEKHLIEELKELISKRKEKIHSMITIELIHKIQDTTSKIEETDSRCDDVLEKIGTFSNILIQLKSEIDTKPLSKNHITTLLTTFQKSNRILNDLEERTSRDIHFDFEELLEKMNRMTPDDKNIKIQLSEIESNYKILKRRLNTTNKELDTTFSNKLELLKQRVSIFLDIKSKIGKIISQVNDLCIPCRLHHFSELKENAEGVLETVQNNVKNEEDRKLFNDELKILTQEIQKKKVRNDFEVAGEVLKYVPFVGPLVHAALTSGNNAEEAKQRNKLSDDHKSTSTK